MNLKDQKPVSLEGVKRPRNRIYRVGIELEGLWKKIPEGVGKLEHDGSVAGFAGIGHIGELPSPPLEVELFEAWMRKHYPTEVNETCGMHVHTSFKSALTYQRLMDPRYPATILAYIAKWGKKVDLPKDHCLWGRLRGESVFCKHQYTADEQVMNVEKDHNRERRGNRYTVMNYCWGRTTTIECRLLPAMPTVDLAIDAVREVINITNSYLVATAKREIKHRGEALLRQRETSVDRQVRIRM